MTLIANIGSLLFLILIIPSKVDSGNPDAKRLYDDLLSNYNKLVRPVSNVSEAVTVHLKLKLSQLIAVNLKNQIMTTNLWVEQFWRDYKLQWNPEEYGGVNMLHVPSDHIWRPDIVLYNNADGNFEVTLATKATLYYTGAVEWKPPAIYHSSCEMDVEYFPFDEQTCVMKFGSWTYDGFQVDLRHEIDLHKPFTSMLQDRAEASTFDRNAPKTPPVEVGIDLTEFYMSVEWDILEVPAIRNVKYYTCCDEPYLDITFNITMRRKTLFYTVNLIIPCMGISFLTILVFYLPSDSGEKVSLSISILLSLTVFFLLLAEIIPPTSLVVPLLGKFVLFTMILDTFSICVTVVVLNVHFRTPRTHMMAPWVRRVFIHILPRLLAMKRPQYEKDRHRCDLLKSPYFSFTTEDNYYVPEENELSELEFNMSRNGFGKKRGEEGTNNIVVRTCNGIEVRKSPYENQYSRHQSFAPVQASPDLAKQYRWTEESIGRHKTPEIKRRHRSPEMPPLTDVYHARPRSAQSNHSHSLHRKKQKADSGSSGLNGNCQVHGHSKENVQDKEEKEDKDTVDSPVCRGGSHHLCPEILKALDGILFIAEHKKKDEESTKIIEDWKYVAMVMDRLFLWIFTVAVLVGTAGIILQAPTLYDDRDPIDYRLSEIGLATARPMAGAYKDRDIVQY